MQLVEATKRAERAGCNLAVVSGYKDVDEAFQEIYRQEHDVPEMEQGGGDRDAAAGSTDDSGMPFRMRKGTAAMQDLVASIAALQHRCVTSDGLLPRARSCFLRPTLHSLMSP